MAGKTTRHRVLLESHRKYVGKQNKRAFNEFRLNKSLMNLNEV